MEISTVELWPMPRGEVLELVKFAKTRPSLADVQAIIDFLNMRFRGVTNPEAFEMIDSIASHFTEEVRQQMEEKMRQYADRVIRSRLNLPEMNLADDGQIAAAVTDTVPVMSGGHRDWAGIYRILVDFCGWPQNYKAFERRVKRLDLKGMPRDKAFHYQGLSQGLSVFWPKTYREWMSCVDGDSTFEHRREVATVFLQHLKERQEL